MSFHQLVAQFLDTKLLELLMIDNYQELPITPARLVHTKSKYPEGKRKTYLLRKLHL
jgi:hypothetical protein